MSAAARMARQTSSPSISGSMRSRTSASNDPRRCRSSPSRPVAAWATSKPASPRYSPTMAARRGSSSTRRMWPLTIPDYGAAHRGHRQQRPLQSSPPPRRWRCLAMRSANCVRCSTVSTSAASARRREQAGARLLQRSELGGAQILDRGAVDGRRGQQGRVASRRTSRMVSRSRATGRGPASCASPVRRCRWSSVMSNLVGEVPDQCARPRLSEAGGIAPHAVGRASPCRAEGAAAAEGGDAGTDDHQRKHREQGRANPAAALCRRRAGTCCLGIGHRACSCANPRAVSAHGLDLGRRLFSRASAAGKET